MPDPEIIRYTADVVVLTRESRLRRAVRRILPRLDTRHVLLIERGGPPHEGAWALPGGHVDVGETSLAAGARELAEEAGVHVRPAELRQIGAWDAPDRDPRGRYVSVAYAVQVPAGVSITAGDDARAARWWPVRALPDTAFDHDLILAAAV